MIRVSAGLQQTLERFARETLPFIAAGGRRPAVRLRSPTGAGRRTSSRPFRSGRRRTDSSPPMSTVTTTRVRSRSWRRRTARIAGRMASPGESDTRPFFGVSGIGRVIEASFVGRDDAGRRELVERVRTDRALAADFRNLVLAYCTEAVLGGGDEELCERLEALLAATPTYGVTLGELYRAYQDLPRPLGKLGRRNAVIWLRALLSLPRVLGYAGLVVLFDETETALSRGSPAPAPEALGARKNVHRPHGDRGVSGLRRVLRGRRGVHRRRESASSGAEPAHRARSIARRTQQPACRVGESRRGDRSRSAGTGVLPRTGRAHRRESAGKRDCRRRTQTRILHQLESFASSYALENINGGAVREYVKEAAARVAQGLSAVRKWT